MIIQPQTFTFSERVLTSHRRSTYTVAATIMILALLGLLIKENFDVQRFLASYSPIPTFVTAIILVIVIISAFVPFFIIFIVADHYIANRWRQLKLQVGPEGLMREAGRVQQTVTWDCITRVRLRHHPSGEPLAIEVFTATGPPLVLFGFESMSEIAGLIKNGIPPMAQVGNTRNRLNWETPLVIVAGLIVAMLVFETIRRVNGQSGYDIFIALVQMLLGIYCLGYGSLSRMDPTLRKWEVIFGVVLMVTSLITLIGG